MKLNFSKIQPKLYCLSIVPGIVIGFIGANFCIDNWRVSEELSVPYPSMYSSGYLDTVGDFITTEESDFKVISTEPINVSLESKFIKELQNFSDNYINTLLQDNPSYDLSDFYLKKSDSTYDLILEDFKLNEPLSMINKSNLQIVKNNQGFLSADGNSASLSVEFEFTVDKILNKSEITDIFEEGKTYRQRRELYLKKDKNNSFKIYELYVELPVEVK